MSKDERWVLQLLRGPNYHYHLMFLSVAGEAVIGAR